MIRTSFFGAVTVLATILAASLLALVAGVGSPAVAQEGAQKPNVILVLADDLDKASLDRMPKIKSLIADQGATFDNYYVTTALCCPSRSTILTGEYVHNHGVRSNQRPNGGFAAFRDRGHERRSVAAHLQPSGYKTGFFGKYLNGYGFSGTISHKPPYWDRWFGMGTGVQKFYKWYANDNGTIRYYGTKPRHYSTNVLSRTARGWIANGVGGGPFFAYVAPTAPHGPLVEPPVHRTEFAGQRAPRPPSFNEADLSDKPAHVRDNPSLSTSQRDYIDQSYIKRLRMMLAVDDMVANLVRDLEAKGELDNTYIFVTSDNGYMQGEHRIPQGKGNPYEESTKQPLLVRGPGITPGTHVAQLAASTDLYSTFADIAGVPEDRDGRSLLPPLRGEAAEWRKHLLLENDPGTSNGFHGVRTERYKYVEYITGEKELYDLRNDPYELESQHASADPDLLADLKAKLDALRVCSGTTCRTAEDAP